MISIQLDLKRYQKRVNQVVEIFKKLPINKKFAKVEKNMEHLLLIATWLKASPEHFHTP